MRLAVVGATGLVGRTMVAVLEERNFPVKELSLYASGAGDGEEIVFKDTPHGVQDVKNADWQRLDFALFALDTPLAKEYVPQARAHCLVIDNSSAYRLDPEVPLVVPEVNPHEAKKHKNLIANPNCTTIQMVVVLAPLDRAVPLKRAVLASYQSVSGAGRDALEELQFEEETLACGMIVTKEEKSALPRQIAGNCIPQIGEFADNGYSGEENKVIAETKRILGRPDLAVTATCVRVPVHVGHAEAVNAEFEKEMTPEQAKKILTEAPGVKLWGKDYPTQLDAAGQDLTLVGRVRKDPSVPFGLDLWIVADNVRKGAATNAVQIAELLLRSGIS